ncbi:glutathione-disulfide reductase [Luteimonas sp. FCS-9]|uniref:glutathione-disulfide reductase n=1 Tax=Luteimonas sp. FCS-9 TaxID=1547516 RepID=UPI00063EC9A7|nr:glutathione-disulfide reductase [Luteimonas sp. FCS-9]KLJ00337.1 glutathione reductase [Luteimonas sp. FCS-9]
MTAAGDALAFDLIVLGGGSGGLAAAFRAAEHGQRVALLEPSELGGTCVNVGCVPKKAMWLAADLGLRIGHAARLGFALPADGRRTFDWPAFLTDRQRYIHNIHASYRWRLDRDGVALLPTRGRLAGQGTVETADGALLRAPHIVLATGSRPIVPDIPGAPLGVVSDDFFGWTQAPSRVAIVGGGYVAVELAGVLQALGSQVDLVVRDGRLLRQAEPELVAQLQDNYRQQGVELRLGVASRALHRQPGGRIAIETDGDERLDGYDEVLFATGRRPNTDDLGLDRVGIVPDPKGHLPVDAFQDTPAPGVHAVGDICGCGPALTPVAIAAARRLCDRLFGGRPEARLDPDNVPSAIFSHPPLAMVGLTEAQARERHGDDVHVYTSRFRPMIEALADTPQCSLFKLVCIGESRRVVGLHLLGDAADEILQGFAVALKMGATLDDFHDTIAIHPTSAEEVVLMR